MQERLLHARQVQFESHLVHTIFHAKMLKKCISSQNFHLKYFLKFSTLVTIGEYRLLAFLAAARFLTLIWQFEDVILLNFH